MKIWRSRAGWGNTSLTLTLAVVSTLAVATGMLNRDQDSTAATPHPMARITRSGHDLMKGRKRFEVWGYNYGIGEKYAILDYFGDPQDATQRRVFADMREAKSLGANTLRVYLEIGSFMRGPDEPRWKALRAYRELLAKAEDIRLYLDVTGNLVWQRPPEWYDELGEKERWNVQARFWRAVARAGHDSRAISFYELTSEPAIHDADTWYTGEFGGYTFIQNLVLDLDGRDPTMVTREWVKKLRGAIRKEDRIHLITVGFLPVDTVFDHADLIGLLDLLAVHIYPEEGQTSQAVDVIRNFSGHGMPVFIGETSPLYTCTWTDFLFDVRSIVDGYLYFYDGRTPGEFGSSTFTDAFLQTALRQFDGLQSCLVVRPGCSDFDDAVCPEP